MGGRVVSLSALESLLDALPLELQGPSLEALGTDTGRRLIERFVVVSLLSLPPRPYTSLSPIRLSADKVPRLVEPLDAVKFLSKDVWTSVFGKPLDNLKTNHKGTFVLTDNDFPWTRRTGRTKDRRLALAGGIVKGSLEGLLGVSSLSVSTDASSTPAVTFQVRLSHPL